MSPLAINQVFRRIPTDIEINGPIISFVQQPTSLTNVSVGNSVSFVGIATVTFPTQSPSNPANVDGTLAYQWYENGSIIAGASSTTYTISGVSTTDDGSNYYVKATYVPTGHGIPSKGTGFPVNGASIDSNIVSLQVRPLIVITKQTTQVKNNIVPNPQPTPTPGYNGPGLYLDLTSFTGNVTFTISTTEESGIFHTIVIPGVGSIPENLGSRSYTVAGGKLYGPCTITNSRNNRGTLYIGSETPVGGDNKLVVEEGGDDWNDMILTVSAGIFRRYSAQPTSVTVGQKQELEYAIDAVVTDNTNNNLSFRWYLNNIELSDGVQSYGGGIKGTFSGTRTKTLKMVLDNPLTYIVKCLIEHPTASNSPLFSDTSQIIVPPPAAARSIVNFEYIEGGQLRKESHDLETGPYLISNPKIRYGLCSFYASEKDLRVFIELKGQAGAPYGAIPGGNGGYSIIRTVMPKNTEFVVTQMGSMSLANVPSFPTPTDRSLAAGQGTFLYRKASLIAVVSGGGAAGRDWRGGDGGGVNVNGAFGAGNGGGRGGGEIRQGPARASDPAGPVQAGCISPRTEDRPSYTVNASGTDFVENRETEYFAGNVLACPIGALENYRRKVSPCADVGVTKFKDGSGKVYDDSASILRGFKAGAGFRRTGGERNIPLLAGAGGNGARGGGRGLGFGAGGGGGSGWAAGDMEVIQTQQGGNPSREGSLLISLTRPGSGAVPPTPSLPPRGWVTRDIDLALIQSAYNLGYTRGEVTRDLDYYVNLINSNINSRAPIPQGSYASSSYSNSRTILFLSYDRSEVARQYSLTLNENHTLYATGPLSPVYQGYAGGLFVAGSGWAQYQRALIDGYSAQSMARWLNQNPTYAVGWYVRPYLQQAGLVCNTGVTGIYPYPGRCERDPAGVKR